MVTLIQNKTGKKPWNGLWLDRGEKNCNNSTSNTTDSFLKPNNTNSNNKNYYLNKDEVNYSYDYVGKLIDKPSETKIKSNDTNKIKVLIITSVDKKRKVLTFDTCGASDLMISDLLKKSGIINTNNTKVSCINDPLLAINYIIETECLFEKDKIEMENDDYDTENNTKVKIKIEHENTSDYDLTDESSDTDFLLNERNINDANEIVIDYPKNTIVIDSKDGKIQILGISKSGIQTLYNIDIYDETCTVYDLLIGIGVSMKNLIKVELIKFPHSSINYIVEHQDIVNSDDVNNHLNIISEFKLDAEQQRRRIEFGKSSTKTQQLKKNNEHNNFSTNNKYLVVEKSQIIFEKKFIRDPRNTLVHKKKNNIVRFLVVTKNGEENLIEVEIFNDKSTVNEIVKAIKKKFQFIGNAKISLIKNYPIFPINYLVEFKDENIY